MLDLLMQNLPILLCLVFGLGLLVVEVFMPGFGLPGISGIVLEIAAIVITYIRHGGLTALCMSLFVIASIAVAITLALRSVNKGKLSQSAIVLNETANAEDGYVTNPNMEAYLGREGVTTTVLRPSGMAEFDGVKVNVVADGEYIPKGETVRVDQVEGARVVVRRIR